MSITCDRHEPDSLEPCKYYVRPDNKGEAGFCKLPSKFRCTEAVKRKCPRLSHSSIQDFIRCKRLYYYKHILGLRVKSTNMSVPVKLGSIWDAYIQTKLNPSCDTSADPFLMIEELQVQPHDAARIMALIRAYEKLGVREETETHGKFIGAQVTREAQIGNAVIRGVYDAKWAGWFSEYKLTGNPSNYDNVWSLSSQIGTYFLLDADAYECLMKIVRRPAQRPKRDEEPTEFEERIYLDVLSRPKYYFDGLKREGMTYGRRFYRREFDLDAVKDRYYHIADEISYYQQREAWYCEYNCYMYNDWCEYLPVCQQGRVNEQIFEYRKIPEQQ